ncbi:UDP-glucose 4-epimerase GalE [Acinetobacter baumannii]|uniref:UDP-glucose 4-epimerase GalE n=1 Tax=Acinetobacter baumannii TaxID=470 RepID=UPI001F444DE2|nr:UDP-glucose 4-epimerase GalE [Acinetobacter baumannii]MCF1334187.1 UDP-glucose 4-epimerase GalE [Acinetobacter baumannii]MDK2129891.1 UDP-glucose 4-epimerase GalE [Acinetobacter baumannii]MDK2160586.1 UDP-glucose 4-epimerase GalE [Acinetobacter baumannii]MDK2168010.1 UDP-glucose 4-epimerase GalE [Acinetobacter baumannii]MDK2251587.1 UDP-glucose 4-epimerase GalE [Acinetobacter baumannii]
MAKILVTGGAGYIGSHTCVELLEAGHEVIVFDNLSNSSKESLNRVQEITQKSLTFVEGDIRNSDELDQVFQDHAIDAVIHFAGLKAVGESQKKPLIYFDNNIAGSIQLVKSMEKAGVYRLVFSSSATVYGEFNPSPYQEDMPLTMPNNNYGYTKLVIEQMLQKLAEADQRWSIALLRYFNPVGAHKSGRIGEDPQGIPNNLMPYVTQVAVGRRDKLSIFGKDYPTQDGTCERDFIHVVDLAKAHELAVLNRLSNTGCRAWNIGTGQPISVLQIKETFEQVNHVEIVTEFADRRAGDLASFYADASRAKIELGWKPYYNLEDMLKDSWNWQKQNPNGYN